MKTKLFGISLVLVAIVAVSFTSRPASVIKLKEQKQQIKVTSKSPVGGLELDDKWK